MMRIRLGMGLLSAATLLLQVALTRIFSVAQFYHFAFLIVSLALLGFGASGSLLVLFSRLRSATLIPWYCLGFTLTTVLAYLFINQAPFDSYSIAWDRTQGYLLIANLLSLAVPFVFAGAFIGLVLSQSAADAGRIYGANLLGSALGAMAAPLLIAELGSARVVLLAAILGASTAAMLAGSRRLVLGMALSGLLIGLALLITFPDIFEVQPSPYKRLSYFRQLEKAGDAEILATRQNASSRLDIIRSPTIHSAPGLSITYLGELPPQIGLLLDGDTLLPVPRTDRATQQLAERLPTAVAYAIRPEADMLILESGGGMEAWAAAQMGASQVTLVEPNALVYKAITTDLRDWFRLREQVRFEQQEIRTFTQQTDTQYDLVLRPLAENYRPISSGAFTLNENYAFTVEAFEAYLRLCKADGLLVIHSWLQAPPSEELRILALILETLDADNPLHHLVVFRTFQTVTFMVKPTPFTESEVDTLLQAIEALRYDLVVAPRMPAEMINQYARLEKPIYHDLMLAMIEAEDRTALYSAYDFRIEPPTDDKPFFYHFFRWEQTPAIMENLGQRWQPFGGSGYFVLLALLIFAIVAAGIFILLPIILQKQFRQAIRANGTAISFRILTYYTAIGLAFLFVEVALIQRYILILGEPTLAIATVIGALLFSSGLGSISIHRFRWRGMMFALVLVVLIHPWLVDLLTPLLLELPLLLRLIGTALLIAPVGFLMGMPFAQGIKAMQAMPDLIPWAWAINGSASVISAVLTATLALSLGFTLVLIIGGSFYLVAAVLAGFSHMETRTV